MSGRPLREALADLRDEGLLLVFSDRVVLDSMRVEVEPDGSPTERLHRLLEPHGLEAQPGGGAWLIVVPRLATVETAERLAPEAVATADPEPRVIRVSEAMVVTPPIELAVHVLDDGEPVRGLGVEDFELSVGGRRREVLDLRVLDLSRLAADVRVTDVPVAARRHFLLLFDTGLDNLASLSRAREIAGRLIAEGVHATDLVGVATLSEVQSPKFALGFTPDRSAVTASIEIATGRSVDRLITDPLGLVLRPAHTASRHRTEPARPHLARRTNGLEPSGVGSPLTLEDWQQDLEVEAMRTERRASIASLLGLSSALRELARMLRHVPGRKHVVFLSEGFDDSMVTGLGGSSERERRRIEEMNRAVEKGDIWMVDSDQRYGNDAALTSFDGMLAEFTRSNSVIHAVNTGVDADQRSQGRQSRDGLARLAAGTGGAYIRAIGDLKGVLRSLSESTAVTYVLSIAPLADDGRGRKLKVRLRRGVSGRVLHPPTLPVPLDDRPASLFERRMATAGQISGGASSGRFRSSLSVVDSSFDGSATNVDVEVSAPASGLTRVIAGDPEAEVYVYALNGDGSVEGYFAARVSVSPVGGEYPMDLRVAGTLGLGPGHYTIRSVVLFPASGASSVASADLEIVPR